MLYDLLLKSSFDAPMLVRTGQDQAGGYAYMGIAFPTTIYHIRIVGFI